MIPSSTSSPGPISATTLAVDVDRRPAHPLDQRAHLVRLRRRREDRLGAAGALLEQSVGVTEQSNQGNERGYAAHARGHTERGIDDRAERDRDRAAADHTVDHGDDGREREELLAPLVRHRGVLEHAPSVVVPGEQEELRLVAGDLLVVVADPVDRDAVAEVLSAALDHSHEGEDAEDIERREHGEREDIERVPDLRCLADEPERDQCAGDREDVERGAGGALARGLRAGALEREVLGGQSGQELLPIRGLRHLTNEPKTRSGLGYASGR